MSASDVVVYAADIKRITALCTQLVGLHLSPDTEMWGTGEDAAVGLIEASLALSDAADQLSKVAAEVEGIAADQLRSLEQPKVFVNDVAYRPRKTTTKTWHEGKAEDAKRELRQALIRTVGVTGDGDLDGWRCDLVRWTLTEFDRFQSISPRSFKTAFYKDNKLNQDEFYESIESYKLEAVGQ